MKNKLLSMIIACVLAFTSICTAASADLEAVEAAEPAGEAYLNAIGVIKAICPDFVLADGDTTTRAEFAAAVADLMSFGKKTVETAPYADVPPEHQYASQIACAKDLGLISTAENFNPDAPIKYNEAIKILVCAVGYGEKAEYTGGYPVAYLKIANDLDLADNVNVNDENVISHHNSTVLIFNAINTDIVEASSFGTDTDYITVEGKNILSVYHDIHSFEGIVDSNEFTGLKSISDTAGEANIAMGANKFFGEGFDELLGRNSVIYYKADRKNSIVYAYPTENTEYAYTSEDDISLSGFKLSVLTSDSSKAKTHTLSAGYSVIYNGKCLTDPNYSSYLNPDSGEITLVDNNGGDIDVIIIKSIDYGVIGSVNSLEEKIYDAYKRGGMLDLSSADYYNIRESDGTPLSLRDLKADDAVGIIKSTDSKRVEIVRYQNAVGGIYESLTSEGTVLIGGSEYKLSKYYTDNIKPLDKLKLGTEIALYLGVGNTVINIVELDSVINYGYVIELGTQNAGSIEEKEVVRMLCSSGKVEVLPLAKSIKLNGVPSTEQAVITRLTVISNYIYDSTNLTNGSEYGYLWRVVKYSVNSKNELTSIWTTEEDKVTKITSGASSNPAQLKSDYQTQLSKVYDSDIVADSQPRLFDDNTAHSNTANTGKVYYDDNMFYPFFRAATGAAVLMVPEATLTSDWKNEKDYSATNMAGLEKSIGSDPNTNCYGYDVDKNGAHLILCVGGSGGGQVGDTSTSRIVESVAMGLNPDGETVPVLKMYYSGKWAEFYAAPANELYDDDARKCLYTGTAAEKVKAGDIVGITVNNDNEIIDIKREFAYLDGKSLHSDYVNLKTDSGTSIDVTKYSRNKKDYVSGYVYSLDGKRAMLACVSETDFAQGNYGVVQMRPANLGSGTVVYVKFDRNKNSAAVYTLPDTSNVESYYTSGMDADYVVIRSRFEEIYLTVIYTN